MARKPAEKAGDGKGKKPGSGAGGRKETKGRAREESREKKILTVLSALKTNGGVIAHAVAAAGVSVTQFHVWRNEDAALDAAVIAASDEGKQARHNQVDDSVFVAATGSLDMAAANIYYKRHNLYPAQQHDVNLSGDAFRATLQAVRKA